MLKNILLIYRGFYRVYLNQVCLSHLCEVFFRSLDAAEQTRLVVFLFKDGGGESLRWVRCRGRFLRHADGAFRHAAIRFVDKNVSRSKRK